MKELKTIKKVQKGNCIINFVEQHNTEDNYIEKLHETVARLLLSNYHKTKEATN